jgi:uncharacterized protein (TIGR03083 family)
MHGVAVSSAIRCDTPVVDELLAYDGVRERVATLVMDHPAATAASVPACPGWSVADVVAHLAGLAEDLASGRIDGWASEVWTAAQVERFRGADPAAVLAAWERAVPRCADAPAFGPVTAAAMALGDAVVHEGDLREVLDPGSSPPSDVVALAVKAGVSRWRAVLAVAAVAPLHIVVPGNRDRWLGEHDAPGAVVLEVDDRELFRVLYGRRSRAEVASLAWSDDPAPFLDAGLPYPFRWAQR